MMKKTIFFRSSMGRVRELTPREPSKRLRKKKKGDDEELEEKEEASEVAEVVEADNAKGKQRAFLVSFKGGSEADRRWETSAYFAKKGPAAAQKLQAFLDREKKEEPAGGAKGGRGKKGAPQPKRSKKEEREEEAAVPAEQVDMEGDELGLEQVDEDDGEHLEEEQPEDEDEDEKEVGDDDSDVEVVVVQKKRRRGRPRKDGAELEELHVKSPARGKGRGKSKASAGKAARPKSRLDEHYQVPMWRMGMVATLLHVPHDVVKSRLLPYLSWTDARSLSRVCRALREDALFHMTKLAKATFGHVVRSDDPADLNLPMACMAALSVPGAEKYFSKTQAMREFCISEQVARQMQDKGLNRGRRQVYKPFDVIEASLKRHKTLERMLEYKHRLNNNRSAKANLRAQLPERLTKLNAALAELHTSWGEIQYAVDGYYLASKWLKNGTGSEDHTIKTLVAGIRKREREMMRKAELRAACVAHGLEVPPDRPERHMYYQVERDEIDEALSAYCTSTATLEAGIASVEAVAQKRAKRRLQVTSLAEQAGFTWADVVHRSIVPGQTRTSWDTVQLPLLSSAESTLQRYIKQGDLAMGVRAAHAVAVMRVIRQVGPEAEKHVRGNMGKEYDPLLFTDNLAHSVMAQICTHRDNLNAGVAALNRVRHVYVFGPPPTDPEADAMTERGENPLLAYAHMEYPSMEEVVDLLLRQLEERKVRCARAYAVAEKGCSVRPFLHFTGSRLDVSEYVVSGHPTELEALEDSVKEFRKDVRAAEDMMISMSELSGEDLETLGAIDADFPGAYSAWMTFGAESQTPRLAEMLLRGVAVQRAEMPKPKRGSKKAAPLETVAVMEEEMARFRLQHPGCWTQTKNVLGKAQDWHTDKVERLHLLRLLPLSKPELASIERRELMCMGWADAAVYPSELGLLGYEHMQLDNYFGKSFLFISSVVQDITGGRSVDAWNFPFSPRFPKIRKLEDGIPALNGQGFRPFVTYSRDLPVEERVPLALRSGGDLDDSRSQEVDNLPEPESFTRNDRTVYNYGFGGGGGYYGDPDSDEMPFGFRYLDSDSDDDEDGSGDAMFHYMMARRVLGLF